MDTPKSSCPPALSSAHTFNPVSSQQRPAWGEALPTLPHVCSTNLLGRGWGVLWADELGCTSEKLPRADDSICPCGNTRGNGARGWQPGVSAVRVIKRFN